MGTLASSDLEQILQQLHQYGVVLVQNVPEPADLFREALLNRIPGGVLLTDVSDVQIVQQQLAEQLSCDPSGESILTALKRRTDITPLLVHSNTLSFDALEYLFSFNAVTDEKGIRLPLLLLESPELVSLFRSGNGKQLVQRIPLSFPISTSVRSGRKLIFVASVLALALGAYSSLRWWPQLSGSYAAETSPQLATGVNLPQQASAVAGTTSLNKDTVPPLPLLSLNDQDRKDILGIVEQWRSAWQRQDWPGYLASYVDQYLPEEDLVTHESWASLRRGRLERPDWIKVDITELKLETIDPYQARVTFWQDYQSPGYADRSFKELRLVRAGKSWRIDNERSIK